MFAQHSNSSTNLLLYTFSWFNVGRGDEIHNDCILLFPPPCSFFCVVSRWGHSSNVISFCCHSRIYQLTLCNIILCSICLYASKRGTVLALQFVVILNRINKPNFESSDAMLYIISKLIVYRKF